MKELCNELVYPETYDNESRCRIPKDKCTGAHSSWYYHSDFLGFDGPESNLKKKDESSSSSK